MPEVVVYCAAGRTPEQKEGLCRDITQAVVKNFGAPIEAVVVSIMDTPLHDKMKGGVMFTERVRMGQPKTPG